MNNENINIKIVSFVERLEKIGIKITLGANFPWIYLTHINGKRVKETFRAEHGFTIGFMPIRKNQKFQFIDIEEIFILIRKYR
jgi:hypothetical protein